MQLHARAHGLAHSMCVITAVQIQRILRFVAQRHPDYILRKTNSNCKTSLAHDIDNANHMQHSRDISYDVILQRHGIEAIDVTTSTTIVE